MAEFGISVQKSIKSHQNHFGDKRKVIFVGRVINDNTERMVVLTSKYNLILLLTKNEAEKHC